MPSFLTPWNEAALRRPPPVPSSPVGSNVPSRRTPPTAAYPLDAPPVTALDYQSRVQGQVAEALEMRRQMNGPLRRLLQTSQVKYTSSVLAISALIVGGVTVTVFLANVAVVYDKEQRIAGLLKIRADLRTRLNSLEKKEPSPLTT